MGFVFRVSHLLTQNQHTLLFKFSANAGYIENETYSRPADDKMMVT